MMSCRKKVRLGVLGYGNRIRKYLQYVKEHKADIELSAVVEIDSNLLALAKREFILDDSCLFSNADDFFNSNLDLDGVIIGTPDDTHYDFAMKSIEQGYHVLLEKPIAQTLKQCQEISDAADKKGVIIVVCYVLRYHPYFRKIKDILASKQIGEIISINHEVNVGLDRMTHTFVRGIWSDAKATNPMIVSKCCHDLDLMVWFCDSFAKDVSSSGSLKWFKSENAPSNSAKRCIYCGIEKKCPYSAVDLYSRRKEWISNFIVPQGSTLNEVLKEELEHGPYGRCVFWCDNNVVDNQVVSIVLENEIAITLSMNCFTLDEDRITKIKCTFGEILANEKTIKVIDFRTREEKVYDFSDVCNMPFHANADLRIVEDFLNTIRGQKVSNSITPMINTSIESHRICFFAEESRKKEE